MSDMSHNHQKKIAVINDMSGFGALFNCCGAAGHFGNEGSVLSTANVDFFQSHGL